MAEKNDEESHGITFAIPDLPEHIKGDSNAITMWVSQLIGYLRNTSWHSFLNSQFSRYRTLSIEAEEGLSKRPKVGPLADFEYHLLKLDEVFTMYELITGDYCCACSCVVLTNQLWIRLSSSPTLGLETAAIQRRAKDAKNKISPPRSQYWKKVLTYIFGGFCFLMWIAAIVIFVSR